MVIVLLLGANLALAFKSGIQRVVTGSIRSPLRESKARVFTEALEGCRF